MAALNQQDISQLLALFREGKFDLVIKKVLPLIRKHRRMPGLHDLAGAAFVAKGDMERAERHLTEAVDLDPKLVSACHNLANLYFQTRQFRKAAAQFRTFMALRPHDMLALRKLGESCLKADLADEAVACFRTLAERDGTDTQAWFLLGAASRALKENDTAYACFERVLDQEPDHVDAMFNLGNICRDMDRHDAALAFYERALHLRPEHISTMCNIGLCHVYRQALKDGASWFDRAIECDPSNPEPQYLRSLPHFLAGDLKAGLAAAIGRADQDHVSWARTCLGRAGGA